MLLNHSWTDEEHRNLHAMYDGRATEIERLTVMIEAVSTHVGDVSSPVLLKACREARSWLPHTSYHDRTGIAGMVFVAAVFEDRPVAERFDAARKRIDAVWNRHKVGDWREGDPAFPIVRHLDNNWWGRCPIINLAWPNEFADALLAQYPAPAPAKAAGDPNLLVVDGNVYVKSGFREHTDAEARAFRDSAYVLDDDWRVVSGPTEEEPIDVPFDIEDWFKAPEPARDRGGRWYLVQHIPSQEW